MTSEKNSIQNQVKRIIALFTTRQRKRKKQVTEILREVEQIQQDVVKKRIK